MTSGAKCRYVCLVQSCAAKRKLCFFVFLVSAAKLPVTVFPCAAKCKRLRQVSVCFPVYKVQVGMYVSFLVSATKCTLSPALPKSYHSKSAADVLTDTVPTCAHTVQLLL